MATAPKQDRSGWGNFGDPSNHPEDAWTKFAHITMPWSNFDNGGHVRKTGFYKLKKGEMVLTVPQQKSVGLKKGGRKKAVGRKRVAGKK